MTLPISADSMVVEVFMNPPKILTVFWKVLSFIFFVGFGMAFTASDEIPPPPANADEIIAQAQPAAPANPYVYKVPAKLTDGWKTGDLREQKADLDKVSRGINQILLGLIPDVHGLVVARHGKIMLEEYFQNYTGDYAHPLFSCTKSVFSTVYGIAQDQGLLSLDQKIFDLYPEGRSKTGWDTQKDKITVGMMLSMTSGLDCDDVGVGTANCGAAMGQSKDWLSFIFALPMSSHEPGTFWRYNGCCLSLLSNLIAQKSGMSFPDYAKKVLLEPLGIKDDSWVTGPNGVNRVDYGLTWKPRDMAKLGQLYLNKGLWKGKRIVSADWVKDASTIHAPPGTSFGHSYGYLWHIKTMMWKGKPIQIFYANGYSGQAIFVSPDADVVCVMTAGSGDADIYSMEENLFENSILGSFK